MNIPRANETEFPLINDNNLEWGSSGGRRKRVDGGKGTSTTMRGTKQSKGKKIYEVRGAGAKMKNKINEILKWLH